MVNRRGDAAYSIYMQFAGAFKDATPRGHRSPAKIPDAISPDLLLLAASADPSPTVHREERSTVCWQIGEDGGQGAGTFLGCIAYFAGRRVAHFYGPESTQT